MLIEFASICEKGPVRAENQDRCVVSDFQTTYSESQPVPADLGDGDRDVLLAVADGMGGAAGGARAAELALETLAAHIVAQARGSDVLGMLRAGFEAAHGALLEQAKSVPELQGMGTTMTAVLLRGDRLYLAHVGDSRAYLLRDGDLETLTSDHSYWTKLRGYDEDAARKLEGGNILVQCVGGMLPELFVELSTLTVCRADTLLLCSDGLHGFADRAQLAARLKGGDIADAAAGCYEDAVAGRTSDNVTAVVARVKDESLKNPVSGEVLRMERMAEVQFDPAQNRLVEKNPLKPDS